MFLLMTRAERMAELRREQGKALVRTMHLTELQAAGAARAAALHESEQHLDRIARVLPDALSAGISLAEIARNTGVSRQTLYELKARYGDGDVHLAVLQVIATHQPVSITELAERLSRSSRETKRVVDDYVNDGLVDWVMIPRDDADDCLCLNAVGSHYLAEWWSTHDQEDQDE
jgi:DNA-binding MarR family transcriptional regulator